MVPMSIRRYFSGQMTVLALALPIAALAQDDQCPAERLVTITIQANPAPSLPGQAVRFNVFVQPVVSVPDPTGTVQLLDGANDLGTFPLVLGQFSTVQTFYSAGARAINAVYGGDYNYCGAVATYGQPVDRITPSVTLSSSASTIAYGAPVILTAAVTPGPPSGVSGPAGPVQFFEGTNLLGTGALSGGKAALTLSSLDTGSHQIVATLVGDPNWYSVRSAPLAQSVIRASTSTQLMGAATASQITLTAAILAVPPSTGVPAGTVQFTDTATGAVLGSASLPPGSSSASLTLAGSSMTAAAGHPITAAFSGSGNFLGSTSTAVEYPGIASAAGVIPASYAADQIVSLFGAGLAAAGTSVSAAPPLPATLGGVSVTVTDSAGTARQAGLYLVAAQQINFVVPAATAPGTAEVAVATPGVVPVRVNMTPVSPGLFDPGAQILRVGADGSQSVEPVTPGVPVAIGSGTVYLVLYGTGIRNRSSLAAVTVLIGSLSLPAAYAGAQPQFPGLDQVNVLLPTSLQGAGKVNVTLSVDGQTSNSVPLTFQ